MANTSIYLYANGECRAEEFIEDDCRSFNNDGTVHYFEFIEGSLSIKFEKDAFYASELVERVVVNLTNELDELLTDESDNYLSAIV